MKILFFASVVLLLYTYVLYPLAIIAASRLARRVPPPPIPGETALPAASFIIAAYNEERVIEAKIEDTLRLDYPREKLQIIVVSDGSNDATPHLVEKHRDAGIVSLHQPERRGKTAALNRAVSQATGEILVFSDANTYYNRESLKIMVRHFRDPGVGGVCGLKNIIGAESRQSSEGDSLYWKYESAIKKAESVVSTIVAADGEIFSMRRSLYRPIDEKVINDDAAMTFEIVRAGYRILYDTEAVSREYASINLIDDFHVKVRMVAGGFQTVKSYFRDLFPPRSLFAFQFLSHKLLRWLCPEFLIAAYVANGFLAGDGAYRALFALQSLFYLLAAAGYAGVKRGAGSRITYLPLYFSMMNLAALSGLFRFMRGRQTTLWRKAAR